MFWARKTFAPSNKNIVLMGDSRIYRGLSPDIMKEELPGLKILNFAFSNGGLNALMFRAAEKKLTSTNHPRVIVLGLTANTLTDYTKGNNQYLQELKRPREEVLERLYLNPVLYWFSAITPQKLRVHFKSNKKIQESYYLNHYVMNGYVESDKFPVDTTEALPSYIKDFSQYQVEQNHLNELFNQVKKWTENGIIVVAYRPPVSQAMLKLENSMGKFDEAKIAKGITQAGGHWIPLINSDYSTYDGSHINRSSAEKLSREIAAVIKAFLPLQHDSTKEKSKEHSK